MEKILPEKNLHLCAALNRVLDEQSSDEQNSALFGNAPKSKSNIFFSFVLLKKKKKKKKKKLTPPTVPKIPPGGKLTFFDISPVEVARQLTLMTFEYYHKLERTEFFHQNWASDSRRHRAPNLMKIISFVFCFCFVFFVFFVFCSLFFVLWFLLLFIIILIIIIIINFPKTDSLMEFRNLWLILC